MEGSHETPVLLGGIDLSSTTDVREIEIEASQGEYGSF